MKEITLNFDGYYMYSSFPIKETEIFGIYCIYAGKYNKIDNTCTIRQLLYIGEAKDVSSRLANHEKLEEWKKKLETSEKLFVSVAKVDTVDRERAEAACIFEHKPLCNCQCIDTFQYNDTEIKISGKCKFLISNFIVKKTC